MTLIVRIALPDLARCDGCGAEGETVQERGPDGQLKVAWLPAGWKWWEPEHLCAECVGRSRAFHAPMRDRFAALLAQLGRGLVADIAQSLGVPVELAWEWVIEIDRATPEPFRPHGLGLEFVRARKEAA
jgi:hypothetical protein